MATLDARYTINGLVRTDQPVWDNIEKLAEACATWVTYDTHAGRYAVIINNAGNSIQSLTEADIIGPIQISGSDLTNLYNAIEIEYPSSEIKDQPYYYRLELPSFLRNPYEPDNTLQMTSEFINNQVQATLIANINLRQSRLDKVVTIITDYTKINLQAGDIIDISSDTYGWENKEFRIMRVREIEGDDGSLRLEFQCLEYDDEVYDEDDISEFLLDGPSGIRAIGSIGIPATPTVTLTTIDSLPAQSVTTTVPEGIIDRMQFWAGNVSITGNVANTDFTLIGTVASTDANSFTEGANVTFTTTALRSGTWAWRARGVNSLASGPFGNVSSNIVYNRIQTPDAIKSGTVIISESGNVVLPALSASWRIDDNSTLADLVLQGTSNLIPVISAADVYMVGYNGQNSYIALQLPPGSQYLTLDLSIRGYVNADTAAIANVKRGIAMYVSTAEWSDEEYLANGFGGLNWSDWTWIKSFKDPTDSLPAGNLFLSIDDVVSYYIGDDPNSVLAIGYSSSLVPDNDDFSIITNPISGIQSLGNIVGFSGNTAIIDSSGGVPNFITPGLSNVDAGYGMFNSATAKISVRLS